MFGFNLKVIKTLNRRAVLNCIHIQFTLYSVAGKVL